MDILFYFLLYIYYFFIFYILLLFYILLFYQNFKNYHAGKLNKTDLFGEYVLRKPQGLFQVFVFALTPKLDDTFTFIWKKILRHVFLFL